MIKTVMTFSGICLSILGATETLAKQNQVDRVDFAKQVLPVLSNKCFVCHGPDTNPETELRLDSFAGASAGGAINES